MRVGAGVHDHTHLHDWSAAFRKQRSGAHHAARGLARFVCDVRSDRCEEPARGTLNLQLLRPLPPVLPRDCRAAPAAAHAIDENGRAKSVVENPVHDVKARAEAAVQNPAHADGDTDDGNAVGFTMCARTRAEAVHPEHEQCGAEEEKACAVGEACKEISDRDDGDRAAVAQRAARHFARGGARSGGTRCAVRRRANARDTRALHCPLCVSTRRSERSVLRRSSAYAVEDCVRLLLGVPVDGGVGCDGGRRGGSGCCVGELNCCCCCCGGGGGPMLFISPLQSRAS